MSLYGLFAVGLTAILTAVANLLLRGGVLRAGGLSLSPETFADQAIALSKEPLFVLGVFLYGAAAVVWFHVISFEELSISYPILVGMTFILVGLGSITLFEEQMSWLKLVGMVTILGGIFMAARA